ncbi:MAG: hypothetical protein UY33_C0017G0018 [Candidatus Amesbacteria bacterium GW2011_GWA1_48_9]|uniref:Uncharacterized protein n=1 Tax=Candidatus Amesbacteria bacterium GW2011_GWA1_48_9 TaxID=1618355 RepID=A0A0G1V0J8_9BACT|nr:MAG: hypothetical protein UY33_C0017G0018 [Candidatus Amesbacteria bacterium GW2011_GWA1_48_9]
MAQLSFGEQDVSYPSQSSGQDQKITDQSTRKNPAGFKDGLDDDEDGTYKCNQLAKFFSGSDVFFEKIITSKGNKNR